MEEGMDEGWMKGWMEGWLEGWWEGFRMGGREGGREAGMKVGEMEGGCRDGWMEGWTEGWTQGWMEAGTEGGMEAGMMEGGIEKGWREGWREGWKDGWRLKWRKREDDHGCGYDYHRQVGMDGGMGWREGWEQGWKEGSTKGDLQGGRVGLAEGGVNEWMEERKDFGCDIDKLETEMELVHFIKEKIYHPPLESFLLKGSFYSNENTLDIMKKHLNQVEILLPTTTFTMQSEIAKLEVFDKLVSVAYEVRDFMVVIALYSRKKFPSSSNYNFRFKWFQIGDCTWRISNLCRRWEAEREDRRQLMSKVIDAVRNPLIDLKILPNLLLDTVDTYETEDSITLKIEELLLIKAFPALGELKESSEMLNFLLEVTNQLAEPIEMICSLLRGSSPAILLIGSLLSFKRSHSDAWKRVHDDVYKAMCDNDHTESYIRWSFIYCFSDLPEFLQECFLYLACYPIGYEIQATCLIKIWIAEGFFTPEEGETLEETAYKYLEQFVQRSLVWVSMRSYSGTIKYCRLPRFIHEIVIEESSSRKFFVVNPDEEIMRSRINRLAIHHDDDNQYTEVKINVVRSLVAFDLDRDVLPSAMYLRVLELRNSTISETTLSKYNYLQYLGLRGSNIRTLPKNIGNMKVLQTLDVRDTNIKTLPESLWNSLALRHVYANPRPQIQGPPPTAILSNLQTLKTVVVPESWLKTFPHSLINLRKLALSNMDNPAYKPNPYWKSISNLLSHVVNLLSMTIIGDIVPAEFVDTRAFPNLESVKSIKLEGRWNYFKLTIDNTKFPPNLTKLTLTKSGLREDPMPRLERLQALKYLSLKDGAYIGNKMVCSANGFPQLDFLELSELKNLEIWEANPMAMPQLTKLRVVKCGNLEKLPDLEHVSDKDIVK